MQKEKTSRKMLTFVRTHGRTDGDENYIPLDILRMPGYNKAPKDQCQSENLKKSILLFDVSITARTGKTV